MNEKQKIQIDRLIEHEKVMAYFYEACALSFPSNNKFWEDIASEEKIHAAWIKNLEPDIETGVIYFNSEKFTESSISTSIEYVRLETIKVKKGEYDERKVLRLSLDLERALIDSGSLELFQTDSNEKKTFLTFLKDETNKHVFLIKEELEKNQKTSNN